MTVNCRVSALRFTCTERVYWDRTTDLPICSPGCIPLSHSGPGTVAKHQSILCIHDLGCPSSNKSHLRPSCTSLFAPCLPISNSADIAIQIWNSRQCFMLIQLADKMGRSVQSGTWSCQAITAWNLGNDAQPSCAHIALYKITVSATALKEDAVLATLHL